MFVWSSIGGVVLGTAITLARKKQNEPSQPIACRKIPGGCARFSVWTEKFDIEEGGQRQFARDQYYFETTPFKVWNVLDLADTAKRPHDGASVYHIIRVRAYERWDGGEWKEEERVMDRFYGTITAIGNDGKSCGRDIIARGGILEVRKCLVGGASNGVETGDKHRSEGKILNFRWNSTLKQETVRG